MCTRRIQRELRETRLRPSEDNDGVTYLLDLDEFSWRFKFIIDSDYPFNSPKIWCQPIIESESESEKWVQYTPHDSTAPMFLESIAISIATDKETTDNLIKRLNSMS